jgi:predicted dehydrogenase|tara:strand:- start:1073 stop:2116 length:1044 start_codon:yes stop_codon:yes gene_type:complete
MEKIKWGIIGPGSIANNFADGLSESHSGQLVGIASKNEDRRKNFGDKYNIHEDFRFNTYEDIINSEHIDAIYISTPHTLHAEWTIKAAGKGKHILCEKPGAVNYREGYQVIEAVREAGVFYAEGFMYRCHPQIHGLVNLIKENKIGDVSHIKSSFGFDMGKTVTEHRLFRKDLAGGAILDVGLYPISFSRLVAGVALGKKYINPKIIEAKGKIGETGVDEISHATLEFDGKITAEVSTAIRETMANNAVITGSKGTITMNIPWQPGREGGPYHSTITISNNDNVEVIDFKGPEHLFFFEAELSSQCIAKEKQELPYPGMTWEDTLGNLKTLDAWRKQINYKLNQDEL